MSSRRLGLCDLLHLCAPIPALILGVITMRYLSAPKIAWSMNLAAGTVGLLVFALVRYSASPANRLAWYAMTIGSVTAIAATFASEGLGGVHRWVSVGGFGLHVSAIVAPVIITSVATAPSAHLAIATAVVTAVLLALQPDAAQTSSFAAACSVILVRDLRFRLPGSIGSLVALMACAIVSFVRPDPLKSVRHVEGILEEAIARGLVWGTLAIAALLLLPAPYFVVWARGRHNLTLALGVYVALVTIAPIWGTFPVPIMGYGVSPILGYCVALALCARLTSRGRAVTTSPPSTSA